MQLPVVRHAAEEEGAEEGGEDGGEDGGGEGGRRVRRVGRGGAGKLIFLQHGLVDYLAPHSSDEEEEDFNGYVAQLVSRAEKAAERMEEAKRKGTGKGADKGKTK